MAAIDISTVKPTDYEYFYIDSNVWLAWLQKSRIDTLSSVPENLKVKTEYFPYIDFFEELLGAHFETDNEVIKTFKFQKPKILFTSILSTEIINAYSRNVCQALYNFENPTDQITSFKKYRITRGNHYKTELGKLLDDFSAIKDVCACVDDKFQNFDFFNSIKGFSSRYDWNDFFYLHFCRRWDSPVITHDGDFSHPDFTILTKLQRMLRRR